MILQGTLGGLTVIYFLPDAISISHAGLAQIFFCLTISLALFTSRGWKAPQSTPPDDVTLQRRLIWLTALVYLQIGGDLLTITGLVYLTGGARTGFMLLYPIDAIRAWQAGG